MQKFPPGSSEAQNAVFDISIVKSLFIFGMIINTLELRKKTNVLLIRKTPQKAFLSMFLCMRNLIQLVNKIRFLFKFVTP